MQYDKYQKHGTDLKTKQWPMGFHWSIICVLFTSHQVTSQMLASLAEGGRVEHHRLITETTRTPGLHMTGYQFQGKSKGILQGWKQQ